MKQFKTFSLAALLCMQGAAFAHQRGAEAGIQANSSNAQTQQTSGGQQQPTPQRRPVPPSAGGLDLSDLGVQIAPDTRLIVMMAALDTAGWDPTPSADKPAVFRELIRRDTAALTPELRRNLQDYYQRHTLRDVPDNPDTPQNEAIRYTPADQAARYISLAYTLGPAPRFETPQRSEELPTGVLEVLDFVPLLREFYRQADFDEKLPNYLTMYRAESDRLRRPASEMARAVLAYLNTRPETVIVERVAATDQSRGEDSKRKRPARAVPVVRERERRFVIVPDLLAAPGSINFRNVGDDYFAVVPPGIDPRTSELRRAYLQFVIDPLVARFHRDVTAKRDAIKTLLDRERERRRREITPDIFLTVSRSLVAAADARMEESARLRLLQLETSDALKKAADDAARETILKTSKEREAATRDLTATLLAESYERGAVLSFYFAEQLRDLEGSGFDISNFISSMLADINSERELRRPTEYAAAVERVREMRRLARETRAAEESTAAPVDARRASLVEGLSAAEELLRVKNYEEAERRLIALRSEHSQEPRVYFALGQAASAAAAAAFDEDLQAERLNAALTHYRQALLFATPDTDRAVIARAHLASGRILAHLERTDEAVKEFEAAMAATEASDRVHQEAAAEKRKLTGEQ